MWIQIKDIIRKHPLFDSTPDFVLWPMTLTFCMDITLDQLNKPWKTAWRWQEHGQKGVTDRWMAQAIHRAARSQLNNWRTTMADCFVSGKLRSQAKTRHHWNAPVPRIRTPEKVSSNEHALDLNNNQPNRPMNRPLHLYDQRRLQKTWFDVD